ncbi:glycoside hydrolase family 3 N-terminal domain-containing protein [Paraglaciecola sp. MB-3u-78]|uniref:glycoside hydrolase family 3 protein n=1 Tax=Paraglaciecola sp. MB-3u-78 TaxID=2058332 RepID=UPI001E511B5A
MAKELISLGFNVNFAPTMDVNVNVNVNPLNPVINVRSYGEDANIVAQLGKAQMIAMQRQGMIATLKHFPGHGDTSVDSHTGLPRVEHDIQQIEAIDLKPFSYAINMGAINNSVIDKGAINNETQAMIMTAHIQYPQLDDTEFMAEDGNKVMLLATMSRKILTDLLRNKMSFKGLIVTDALNMAGIVHYFDQTEAVIQTFSAGADIALMPISIRRPADIVKLKQLISDVAKAVQQGRLNRAEMEAAVQRIAALKASYQLSAAGRFSQQNSGQDSGQDSGQVIDQAIITAQATLGSPPHKKVEQQLANSAIVAIKNNGVLPEWHLIKDKVP